MPAKFALFQCLLISLNLSAYLTTNLTKSSTSKETNEKDSDNQDHNPTSLQGSELETQYQEQLSKTLGELNDLNEDNQQAFDIYDAIHKNADHDPNVYEGSGNSSPNLSVSDDEDLSALGGLPTNDDDHLEGSGFITPYPDFDPDAENVGSGGHYNNNNYNSLVDELFSPKLDSSREWGLEDLSTEAPVQEIKEHETAVDEGHTSAATYRTEELQNVSLSSTVSTKFIVSSSVSRRTTLPTKSSIISPSSPLAISGKDIITGITDSTVTSLTTGPRWTMRPASSLAPVNAKKQTTRPFTKRLNEQKVNNNNKNGKKSNAAGSRMVTKHDSIALRIFTLALSILFVLFCL